MDTNIKRGATRSWVVLIWVLLLVLGWQNPLSAQPSGDSPAMAALQEKASRVGSVRIIVQLDASFSPEGALRSTQAQQQRKRITQAQAVLLDRIPDDDMMSHLKFGYTPLVAMEVTHSGLQTLMASPGWAQIYEDKLLQPSLSKSTPLVGSKLTQSQGFGGSGQTIAIIDTGVDTNHPFLSGKVVEEACFSTTDHTAGSTTTCPNGSDTQIGSGAARPYAASIVGRDHGTHVAGIAAGGNPGISFTGIAPDAKLIAIQAFSIFRNNDPQICDGLNCASSFTSDLIAALEHVYSLRNTFNIASVNMSLVRGAFSSPCDDDPLKLVIDLLRSVGIASIAASGNDGFTSDLSSPACISSVISVGSSTKSDKVSGFSNSASFLDLLAPGQSIRSSIAGSGYAHFSGTSMATPHVAGAWAVMKNQNPTWTVNQILTKLKSWGVPVTDSRNGLTKPRLLIPIATFELQGLMEGPRVCGDNSGTGLKEPFKGNATFTIDLSALPVVSADIKVEGYTDPFTLTGIALFKNKERGRLQLFGDDGNSREIALSGKINLDKKTREWLSIKGKFQFQDPSGPVCNLVGKFKVK
jgi:subtilisin